MMSAERISVLQLLQMRVCPRRDVAIGRSRLDFHDR